MSRRRGWIVAAVAALATTLLLPVAADWLVTRDGTRIETAGPWRVESRLVVFKRPDGTYASMRLSEVDLEASERLTGEMKAKAEPPPEEARPRERQVVARLTEKELPPMPLEADPEDEQESTETAEAKPPSPLEIVSWREVGGPSSEGLEIEGTVRNNSDRLALGVVVSVELFDRQGESLGSSESVLTSTALPPGQSSGFRVSFPGILSYGRIEIGTRGDLMETREPGPETPPQG